ncbi:MAG: helix-turn-helix domain-containing protein [Faecousia sp.]
MLGARIAALRREAGLSQAELAARLQVSPSALGMYEQERREPSVETLVRLSRVLGVTTDYLLTGEPAEEERAALDEMLLSRIRAADRQLEQHPFSREELAVLFAAMLME